MTSYNLDKDEDIDTITINGFDYQVGDLPLEIITKVEKISTKEKLGDILEGFRPIMRDLLKIKNPEIDTRELTDDKVASFMSYVLNKIKAGQI